MAKYYHRWPTKAQEITEIIASPPVANYNSTFTRKKERNNYGNNHDDNKDKRDRAADLIAITNT